MKVAIHDKSPGQGSEVLLDGKNIAGSVRSIQIDSGVGMIPRLTLDLLIHYGLDFEGDANVAVSDATCEALIAIGWTPPAEPTA